MNFGEESSEVLNQCRVGVLVSRPFRRRYLHFHESQFFKIWAHDFLDN
jgi:hypothetical protein